MLRACYAASGTELRVSGTEHAQPPADLGGYGPTRAQRTRYCIGLRACYAMPGTDRALAIGYAAVYKGPTALRVCYAVSGTDGGYCPTPRLVLTSARLLPQLCGNAVAMRCPVLT
eukprot:3941522-Rhodomonas_salina.4